ncbi:MAG: ANTAR domain-containing protein [Streptosporangiaceae bacterium]|nr:ANTAR domain-containing protein [Streptosporangiaceae bacterium]MBV9853254.1 ANTAR domain-containing protein [Streptosporangiaceae bacterium]
MVLADLLAAERVADAPASARQSSASSPAPASVTTAASTSSATADLARGSSPLGPTPLTASTGPAARRSPPAARSEAEEAARLAVTVAQLEHALASRVGVEQAIGVLAERHRLRPREAFDLLRGAARSRGQRVAEIAQDVVASATNPLLRLPEELARKLPAPRPRGRSLRRARHAQQAN